MTYLLIIFPRFPTYDFQINTVNMINFDPVLIGLNGEAGNPNPKKHLKNKAGYGC